MKLPQRLRTYRLHRLFRFFDWTLNHFLHFLKNMILHLVLVGNVQVMTIIRGFNDDDQRAWIGERHPHLRTSWKLAILLLFTAMMLDDLAGLTPGDNQAGFKWVHARLIARPTKLGKVWERVSYVN